MRTYFDPSAFLALYVAEEKSDLILTFLEENPQRIPLNSLQEIEMRNGVRQKVMRGEIDEASAARTLRALDDDIVLGRVVPASLNWTSALTRAERLSRRQASKIICRTYDLLHVAIAIISRVNHFVTLDRDQARLAEAAGLNVIVS